jgi:hypothetical protein
LILGYTTYIQWIANLFRVKGLVTQDAIQLAKMSVCSHELQWCKPSDQRLSIQFNGPFLRPWLASLQGSKSRLADQQKYYSIIRNYWNGRTTFSSTKAQTSRNIHQCWLRRTQESLIILFKLPTAAKLTEVLLWSNFEK